MKEYIKPELEVVTLMAEEAVATSLTGGLSGEMDTSTNPFND